ncbi:MAG: TraB/GumN family protein [Alphaproteobacteria bacterium]|uniref:TraB/GumN family protein n=1 Tax=Brevundimonas sp. TaxID=1871086 RepID=UPI00182C6D6E|nr:TraB/GumN family protein [Brevundimonas sp.]MBA3051468.1 TraB/GumN family protein [Brevundimonas sp.]MBU3972840.1 TraB/GumN family protein [Alphaproteobacteria bacterium]MBU4038960.1 TraB/GumN family protein [Alphaproteobacteria bacterium]MBU4135967.1 TraB/GumN family protein [Alphaproteobacteria bacterium]
MLLLAGTGFPASAGARTPELRTPELQTPEPQAAELDEIVVLARRSGAPMWTVTRGDTTLILVGAITGIPRDLAWRPDDLEAAAARSDQILTPQEGRASFSDVLRVIWRIRTIARMPNGQTSADYLTPDWQGRLETVMADERNEDWRNKSLLILGFDLMQDKAGYAARRGGDDAVDVIRRAARRARVSVRPVGTVRGDELIDSLITAPQSAHIPCVQAAIAAAEQGPEAARERAEDWRALRVADVVASPIDRALNECWPWGDPEIAPQLRQQWAAAIETAMISPGVTMGVAPIRLLADEGGVLDGLKARGFEVVGPEWK